MDSEITHLFVYGTLLDQNNPHGAHLAKNAKFFGEGKIKGRLYDIGNYPGAVADVNGSNWVYGSVFKIDNNVSLLKELDDYEGFGDDFAKPNEFIRDLGEAETENGNLVCWVYFYNHPSTGKKRIYSGRYL